MAGAPVDCGPMRRLWMPGHGHGWLGGAAAALVLAACAGNQPVAPPGQGASGEAAGIVVVTDGGTALSDGAADVPPTLDLRIAGGSVVASAGSATLDGAALPLARTGDALVATTPPMPLGSDHSLVLHLPGRSDQKIRFNVVGPAEAYAAVHTEAGAGEVLDLVLSLAPSDPAAVTGALPPGGAPAWRDPTHLRATWAAAPRGGRLQLPRALATARGSQLGGPLDLDLGTAPASGTLRTAVTQLPASAQPAPGLPLIAFTTSTAASHASLQAHAAQVSVISPTGLTAGADGSLAGAPDAVAVSVAGRHGIPLLPLLQNADFSAPAVHTLLTTPAAATRLVGALRSRAAAEGWAGVHLDMENVPGDDRDALSALVASLATGLHADGRRLDVAVVPHRPGHINAVNAAYDLAAIGRSADRVTLMAYEEHSPSTDPGPVAGLAWDRQILDGSLGEVGEPGRGLLGMPLYARTWDGSGGAAADSYSVSVRDALAVPGGARVDYDFLQGTPSIAPQRGGPPVTWFDDAHSLALKVTLAGSHRMGGIAVWRLGFEDPEFWSVVSGMAAPAAS